MGQALRDIRPLMMRRDRQEKVTRCRGQRPWKRTKGQWVQEAVQKGKDSGKEEVHERGVEGVKKGREKDMEGMGQENEWGTEKQEDEEVEQKARRCDR